MTKNIQDYVWPVAGYTDKIHSGIKIMFQLKPWLTFTVAQMKEHLVKGFPWLANPNPHQSEVLSKIIKTGIQKLIQKGLVQKVHSTMTVDPQWQWAAGVDSTAFDNISGTDNVAKTADAQKAVKGRALGGKTLWRLNNLPKNS